MADTEDLSHQANLPDDQAGFKRYPWDQCKKEVEILYCEREWPLHKVRETILARHSFQAT